MLIDRPLFSEILDHPLIRKNRCEIHLKNQYQTGNLNENRST